MKTTLVEPSQQALALHAEVLATFREARRTHHRGAVLLQQLVDAGYHLELGYRDLTDYAENALDLSHGEARTLVEICRSQDTLPVLVNAVSDGLPWTKAREILKVATTDTERAWVERAQTVNNRVLERQVQASQRGELPPKPGREKDPPMMRYVIGETATVNVEIIRAAIQWSRGLTGLTREDIDDGEIIAQMLQRVMHDAPAGDAPTGERYKIIVEHCPECGKTEGADAELTDTTISMARCHAQVVEMRPGPKRGHTAHNVPPAIEQAVRCRDKHRCRVPGCRNIIWTDLHHVRPRSWGGRHVEENLVSTCSGHHTAVHDGKLGIDVRDGGFQFSFPDGREEWRPLDPRLWDGRVPRRRVDHVARHQVAYGADDGGEMPAETAVVPQVPRADHVARYEVVDGADDSMKLPAQTAVVRQVLISMDGPPDVEDGGERHGGDDVLATYGHEAPASAEP